MDLLSAHASARLSASSIHYLSMTSVHHANGMKDHLYYCLVIVMNFNVAQPLTANEGGRTQ